MKRFPCRPNKVFITSSIHSSQNIKTRRRLGFMSSLFNHANTIQNKNHLKEIFIQQRLTKTISLINRSTSN